MKTQLDVEGRAMIGASPFSIVYFTIALVFFGYRGFA